MESENKNSPGKTEVKNVVEETFAGDLAKVIGDNETGIVRKIIEEQEKTDALDKKTSPENKKNKIFLFLGIFLVILAFGAVSLVFLFRKQIFTVPLVSQYVPLIFTDKTEFKEVAGLEKDQIIQTILNEASSAQFKSGGVEGIYLTVNKKVVGFRNFLDLMEANLDQTQITFIDDNFMIGAVDRGGASIPSNNNDLTTLSDNSGTSLTTEIPTEGSGRDLFILVKMRSVADIFDPMRTWESKMFSDLHGLFGVDINPNTAYLLTKNFTDEIIQNKNARILYDNSGNIVMMYVYAEDDSLIIANSESAAVLVMSRLSSNQVKK